MILLTGASGVVGGYMQKALELLSLPYLALNHSQLIPPNLESCFKSNSISTVIHLAAETDVDLCERDPVHAYKSNVQLTKNIAAVCAKHNASIFFISSGNVFGATNKTAYSELDTAGSINIYGKTKIAAENVIKDYLQSKHYIIRCGWMIGGGEKKDKKFSGKIINLINSNTKEIMAVNDKIGSLTYAKDLSEFIIFLLNKEYYGTYHFSADGILTRSDFANFVAAKLNKQVTIKEVPSAFFPLSAPRPYSEAIISYSLSSIDYKVKTWQEVLTEYLNEWIKK